MQPFHRLRYTSGFAAVIAVTGVAAACSNLVPLSRVAAAEAKWTASRIQNYRYTLEIGSLMPFTECSPRRRMTDHNFSYYVEDFRATP
jgi:hypothetical protein